MIDRARLRSQLISHEDNRQFVYDDATGKPIGPGSVVKGNPSIGIGRNLHGKGLSLTERAYLLDNDISDALREAMIFPWFEALDPVRQNVVVELIFNMGLPRFRTFKQFIRRMSERQWTVAAYELEDSLWSRQVDPIRGDDKGRADVLIRMIRTGEWP